jgi:hypothetical protein
LIPNAEQPLIIDAHSLRQIPKNRIQATTVASALADDKERGRASYLGNNLVKSKNKKEACQCEIDGPADDSAPIPNQDPSMALCKELHRALKEDQ